MQRSSHHRTGSNPFSVAGFTEEASASLLSPGHHHYETPLVNRQASIAAQYVGYVGSEDQLLQAGILPDNIMATEAYIEDRVDYIEDRLDEYENYDKKVDGSFLRSMVSKDADFKKWISKKHHVST